MRRETDDPSVPRGWQNLVLSAALSSEVYFGLDNPIDALREQYADKLAAWQNYRAAVFIEEQVINSPEGTIVSRRRPRTNSRPSA